MQWRKKNKPTQKASSQFSGCFSVESIHPGVESTFWKWDDNSFSHPFALCFCEQGCRDWKNHQETGKIQSISTTRACRAKYSTDYIIQSCQHVWGWSFRSLQIYLWVFPQVQYVNWLAGSLLCASQWCFVVEIYTCCCYLFVPPPRPLFATYVSWNVLAVRFIFTNVKWELN